MKSLVAYKKENDIQRKGTEKEKKRRRMTKNINPKKIKERSNKTI